MTQSTLRRALPSIAAWLILLGILSMRGFFSNFSALPPRLSIALLTPLPFVLWFVRSQTGKGLVRLIPPQWPIYLQSFRILVEIGLWILVRNGTLPVQMSFEGRNFDILTGLLALPVGYCCFVKKRWPAVTALIYNIAGLALLLNIVIITALNMPGISHQQPDSSAMTRFPLIYVPGLLVPLAYTLHIFSFRQYRPAYSIT